MFCRDCTSAEENQQSQKKSPTPSKIPVPDPLCSLCFPPDEHILTRLVFFCLSPACTSPNLAIHRVMSRKSCFSHYQDLCLQRRSPMSGVFSTAQSPDITINSFLFSLFFLTICSFCCFVANPIKRGTERETKKKGNKLGSKTISKVRTLGRDYRKKTYRPLGARR